MSETETQVRRHGDIFTAEEAAAYLNLDNVATLDWCRAQGFLGEPYKVGKRNLYWRADLDDCAKMMFGETVKPRVRQRPLTGMRLAGGE